MKIGSVRAEIFLHCSVLVQYILRIFYSNFFLSPNNFLGREKGGGCKILANMLTKHLNAPQSCVHPLNFIKCVKYWSIFQCSILFVIEGLTLLIVTNWKIITQWLLMLDFIVAHLVQDSNYMILICKTFNPTTVWGQISKLKLKFVPTSPVDGL